MAADGRVVDFGYGCGAHSDTPAPQLIGSPAYEPYDDGVLDMVEVDRPVVVTEADVDVVPEAAIDADSPAEQPQAVDAEPEAP
jgi:hypothetical protein